MEIVAIAKNVRISPEKVKLVIDSIKKLSPKEALENLQFVNKKASAILKKVINSAIANAKHNFGLEEEGLIFKEIAVSKGMVFKRYQPVSRGRVHHILKRTSHIKVVLEGKEKKASKVNQESKKSDETEFQDHKSNIKNKK